MADKKRQAKARPTAKKSPDAALNERASSAAPAAQAAQAAQAAENETTNLHDDLQALLGEIRKRDRQTAVARMLVDAYAATDGVDPDVAWSRHLRSIEIARASELSKRELRHTEVADLVAEIEARIGKS